MPTNPPDSASSLLPDFSVTRGGIKYGQQYHSPELDKARREIKALRAVIKRHAREAEEVRERESVHDYCEGHALCDLVASCVYDAASLTPIPYIRNPED